MFTKRWLINLILLGAAVFLGMKAYEDWHRTEEAPPEAPVARRSTPAPPEEPVKIKRNSKKHYEIVAGKNLFSSKREEPPPQAAAPVEKKKAKIKKKKASRASKRVVLYGTFSLNGEKKALIQDPTQRKRGKKNTWVKEGDEVAGMTVARIETRKILLNDGVENHEILLYDSSKPKPRRSIKRPPQPTIIATGTGRGATPASKVGRPKKIKPKKTPQRPKKKSTKKPPRVRPKKKATVRPNRSQNDASSQDGRTSNPFENLLRRE